MFNLQPYQGNESYIFVSYSHKDQETVYYILEAMQQKGYRLWYDEGIDPGTEWADAIANRIRKCKFFLAFISQNYLNSENCKDELSFSRDIENIERLLIYLEDVTLPDGIAMRVNRLQSICKYKHKDEGVFYNTLYSVKKLDCCNTARIPVVIPHYATLKYPNGDHYVGYVEGQEEEFAPEGKGKYTFSNGDVYEGEFECGFRIYGKMTYANGDVYEGHWSPIEICEESCNILGGEEKNGEGILHYANGDEYNGSWLNGKRHGQGIFTSLDQMCIYVGEWFNDQKHGEGKMIYANKTTKKGKWENDKLIEWIETEQKLP